MQDTTHVASRVGSIGGHHDLIAASLPQGLAGAASAAPKASPGIEEATVFVVDDDRAVREAIRDLLEDHGFAVELFADGDAFLDAFDADEPGCLLIDAQMPGLGGIEVLERLKADGDAIPAVVISGHAAVPMVVRAMKAGAVDFLEKPVRSRELLASIRRALDQGRQRAAIASTRKAAAQCFGRLTPRQHQILDLVLAGHPSKNIAADLGISQRTVETHRAAIMRKTCSKSIAALARHAISAQV